MLSELCRELKNWFDKRRYFGIFEIENGEFVDVDYLQVGQYFRIVGSVFNDGVYEYTGEPIADLKDEQFQGAIWALAIPNEVISLSKDIAAWQAKYGSVDSQAMSPFNSESFGGYSYSKSAGGSGSGANSNSWQAAFADRLNMWRKIR